MTALLAGFVASLMFLAAIGKAVGLDEFGGYLAELGVPKRIRATAGVAIIAFEVVISIAVVLDIAQPLSTWAAAGLTSTFVLLQIRNVIMVSVGCSCYGAVDRSLDSRLALVRASILFAGAFVLALNTIAPSASTGASIINKLIGAGAGATLLASIALLNYAALVVVFDRELGTRVAAVSADQIEGDVA